MKKIAIVSKTLPHYRTSFFNGLRENLLSKNIELVLIYGQPSHRDSQKSDAVDVDWGIKVPNKIIKMGRVELYWQPVLKHLKDVDLVIVEQASKLLLNYILVMQNVIGIRKVAFWGHGKNFQKSSSNKFGEWIKKQISTHVHWWFAYNDLSAEIVQAMGFPRENITSVQNAIDTRSLTESFQKITQDEIVAVHKELDINSDNIAIFSGGMYPEKQIPFLLESLIHIRKQMPDFHMVFIGGGVDAKLVAQAAAENLWIHFLGPVFGNKIVPYFAISKVILIPGAAGLVVLDSFAFETPIITINIPSHGPEISYLVNMENGLIIKESSSPSDYAVEVVKLLQDSEKLYMLIQGCKASREKFTIENMIDKFVEGVYRAIDN